MLDKCITDATDWVYSLMLLWPMKKEVKGEFIWINLYKFPLDSSNMAMLYSSSLLGYAKCKYPFEK